MRSCLFDPPYYSKYSDNEYVRRYHFIEGLVKNWKDVEIQEKVLLKNSKNIHQCLIQKWAATMQ